MPRLYLGLVLHNHQPVGNYGFVIEQIYDRAYLPMLDALERHPAVRVALHNSGCLLDWIAAHRPGYIDRVRALGARGQVELMTGGYYEPILPMIPDADKLGQITKLTKYVEAELGQRPAGLWLTERVWEPGLPAPLADAGVDWTLVDDAHFRIIGLRDEELRGYFVTEDQGKRVNIFAGSQRLRYTIPWAAVDDVIAELRRIAESSADDTTYIVLGDDGEKFGAWPNTYEHVWTDGWMERFLAALDAESSWLETMTPGEYARRFDARGLVYLPAASYAEMMEWALPPDASAAFHRVWQRAEADGRTDILAYLRGGFWRYFLARYPESNAMHKRGLRIDAKLADAPSDEARGALWQAQCNCPYWHGVFGGLYLRHIRGATNANLIRAERVADEAAGARGVAAVERDFDFDGHREVLLQSPDISLMVHPASGGMISEFDLRRRDHALLDVIARRREAYHASLAEGARPEESHGAENIHGAVRVKEAGLAELLSVDRHRRGGLQEWLLDEHASVEEFARGVARTFWEPAGVWTQDVVRNRLAARVVLARESDGIRVSKRVDLPARSESLEVEYELSSSRGESTRFLFASEWNLSPPQSPEGDDRTAVLALDGRDVDLTTAPGVEAAVRRFALRGSAPYVLSCDCDDECDVWHFPVDTVSSSEGGLERVPQGVSVSLVRRIELAPGETSRFGFRWQVVEPPTGAVDPKAR